MKLKHPCTAVFHIDGGRPPQITCHSRVVGLPHDVTARLVIILLTCLSKAVKGSPAPLFPCAAKGNGGAGDPFTAFGRQVSKNNDQPRGQVVGQSDDPTVAGYLREAAAIEA